MADWLLIATPFIVLPLVALFVFAGCGIDTAGQGEAVPEAVPEDDPVLYPVPIHLPPLIVHLPFTARLRCTTVPEIGEPAVHFAWSYFKEDGTRIPGGGDAVLDPAGYHEYVIEERGATTGWMVTCLVSGDPGTQMRSSGDAIGEPMIDLEPEQIVSFEADVVRDENVTGIVVRYVGMS